MNDHDIDLRTDDSRGTVTVHERRSVGEALRLVIVALLIVALVLVALDNTDDVRIGYVFGDASAPIWIVLLGAAVAGVIIGWLIRHRPHRRS